MRSHMSGAFEFNGFYRVQSNARSVPSSISGVWLTTGKVDNGVTNCALKSHRLWQGRKQVNLQPADIVSRSGQFQSETDILYKRSSFTPNNNSCQFPSDIVDVQKSVMQWRGRQKFGRALFGRERFFEIEQIVSPLDQVVADEYFLHEAGHLVGLDVGRKEELGYFRPAGRISWSLVCAEEFRADMEEFGFAIKILSRQDAQAIFLYNIFLRLTVHCQGLQQVRVAPYGIIPFLLYCILREVGFLTVARCGEQKGLLAMASIDESSIVGFMQACAEKICLDISAPECDAGNDMAAAAIPAASWIRSKMLNDNLAAEFANVMSSAAVCS